MTAWTDLAGRLLDLTVAGAVDWEPIPDPLNPDGDEAVQLVEPSAAFLDLADVDVILRCEQELMIRTPDSCDRYPLDSYGPYWAARGATARHTEPAS